MRLDSPGVLATAGTLAIHILLAVLGGALIVSTPAPPPKPPKLTLVDVEIKPPPPPAAKPEPPPPVPQPEAPKQEAPKPVRTQRAAIAKSTTPPPTTEPPPTTTPSPDSGGSTPVTTMGDIAPAAVAHGIQGKPNRGYGQGGSGGGTGSGTGTGSSDAPAPMSVATIKKRALPKGDFSYFDASKDYPAEARQLGIEGVIRVRLVVDDAGHVKSAVLLNKLGHGLDELAISRAKKIEFDPATDTDDKPVTSVVIWTFNMTLPK